MIGQPKGEAAKYHAEKEAADAIGDQVAVWCERLRRDCGIDGEAADMLDDEEQQCHTERPPQVWNQ